MPFRIKKRERRRVSRGLKWVLREQLWRGIRELTDPEEDPFEAVHQLRKRIKKIRGGLRLVRHVADGTAKAENKRLRDVARRFAPLRDAQSRVETCERVIAHCQQCKGCDAAEASALTACRAWLIARRDAMCVAPGQLREPIRQAVQELTASGEAIDRMKIDAAKVDELKPGWKGTRRRVRKRMNDARQSGSPEDFHEWRKRVKDAWYQSCILNGGFKNTKKKHRRRLRDLADLLGRVHDLDELARTLDEEADAAGKHFETSLVQSVIDRRRKERAGQAMLLGKDVSNIRILDL